MCFVLAGVEEFGGHFFGEGDLEQPSVSVGVGVDQAWAFGESGIDCRDGAGDG